MNTHRTRPLRIAADRTATPAPRPFTLLVVILLLVFAGTFCPQAAPPVIAQALRASLVPISAESPGARFTALSPPEVSARAAYVFDATVGTELYALNADERRAPASLTKVATALTVLQHANLDDEVTIDQSDLVDESESQVGLVSGDKLTVRDLLRGLLIPSGNDAAHALARHVGASFPEQGASTRTDPVVAFVDEMNRLVASLGLRNTHFTNAAGLDQDQHFSSARDLALLAQRAMQDPIFADIVATTSATLPSQKRPEGYFVQTTNDLLEEGLVEGIKTGTTGEAGGCLISSTTFGANRVISVVLGSAVEITPQGIYESPARFSDTRAMLAAIPDDYHWIDPSVPGTVPGLAEELSVWQTTVPSGATIVVPNGRAEELRYRLMLGPPARPDEVVGTVLFFVGSDLLSERPVLQAATSDGEVAWTTYAALPMSPA